MRTVGEEKWEVRMMEVRLLVSKRGKGGWDEGASEI